MAGPAYRWVDENGQVHYSDRPREGAEEVRLPEYRRPQVNRPAAQPQPAARRGSTAPATPATPTAAEQRQPYRAIDIMQPTQQQTLWNTGGVLDVAVNLQPRLQPSHRMAVYLDGDRLDVNPGSTNFQLSEVFRGMHTLQVAIVDSFDQEIVRSLPVQFMVQQTSVLNPQRANSGGGQANPNPGGN